MKKETIEEAIKIIKSKAPDDEDMCILENNLYTSFIEYVAKRQDHVGEKAKLVLSTKEINFNRFCY